ncbi:unnamed protein product [Choristocarpus tenellus]
MTDLRFPDMGLLLNVAKGLPIDLKQTNLEIRQLKAKRHTPVSNNCHEHFSQPFPIPLIPARFVSFKGARRDQVGDIPRISLGPTLMAVTIVHQKRFGSVRRDGIGKT